MLPYFDVAGSFRGRRGASGGGSTAHRYWRITALDVPATDWFEISEIQVLENSVNVTGSATKSSSHAPSGGNGFASLFDGVLTTRAYWPASTAENPGFWIKFDFGAGSAKTINGVKQGGFDNSGRYMRGFTLQWSDDDLNWTTLGSKSGLTYPGNFTLSAEYTF